MKAVVYGDGRLTFRIPDEWQEGRGPDGEATYAEPARRKGRTKRGAPSTGVGRLEVFVVAVESETGTDSDALLRVAAAGAHQGDPPPQLLPDGYAFRRFTRLEETAAPVRIVHWWHLAAPVAGTVRLAVFAYTQGDEPDDPTPGILEREIVRARFAEAAPSDPADGDDLEDVTAAGITADRDAARARRPWWRFW